MATSLVQAIGAPADAQRAASTAAATDDPRDGWRPASEGGDPAETRGPRVLDGDGVARDAPAPPKRQIPPAKRVSEVAERRSANSKVFQLEDGRLQQELSTLPVHYRDRAGKWQPIDTTVKANTKPGFVLGNETNSFRSYFGAGADRLVRFEAPSGAVTLGVPDAEATTPVAKDNTVTYADALGDGIDLAYELTPEAMKERVVLAAPPDGDGDVELTFDLGVDGLRARQRDNGSIVFEHPEGDGRVVLVMPAPYMVDAADDQDSPYGKAWSDKVTQTLSEDGESLTVKADGDWLRDSDRKYPVVIDPTIKIAPTPTVSQDTMILSETPTINYETNWRLSVGTTNTGVARSLVKFPLSEIPEGTKIDTAQLQLWYDQYHTSNANAVTLEAHRATQAWNETQATWENANNNVGELGNYTTRVDDGDPLQTQPSGTWPYSTTSAQYQHAVNQDFAYNNDAATGSTYTWYPCTSESGTYRAEAHFVTASDRATNVPYTVHHKNGTNSYTVNQSGATVASKWAPLGTHQFDAGCGVHKAVVGDVASKVVVADGIRLVKDATTVRPAGDNGTHWHSFSVQNLVQGWVDQPSSNHGFVIKAADEATLGQGGPRYEGSIYAYNGETANRPKLVVTWGRPGVVANVPTTIHANGAELNWPAYVDPCGFCPDDDIIEYQVHRSIFQTFTPNAATLVAPVASGTAPTYSLADTTAEPTPADSTDPLGNAYYYMVAVKTRDGGLTPGPTVIARLPKAGRVTKILSATADVTLASGQPDTNNDRMFGEPWLYAGNNSATYAKTRTLIRFPVLTGVVPTGAQVEDARVRLWGTEVVGDSNGIWELRGLTRDFNETQATWNKADSATNWTTAGGDVGTPVGSETNFENDPKRRNFAMTALVQWWLAAPTSNKGVMIKLADEAATAPQTRAIFLSSEGEEPDLRPELAITYVEKTPESTYYAPTTPDAVGPESTTTLPVTLTNTTGAAWDDAQWKLSYWWTRPDGTPVSSSQLQTTLPRDVANLDTVTVQADVKAPAVIAGENNQRTDLVLNWDLYNTSNSTWLSTPGTNSVGALKQSLAVEQSTSDQVGLETFYGYVGKSTGAGSALANNLHAGNVVWSYDAFNNPSRGLATFLRMAYNSKDTSDSVAGFGWSVQASSIMRLGTPMDPHPNSQGRTVSLTDGDGTTHTFTLDDKGNSDPLDDEYLHPAGVHLYLQRLKVCEPNDKKDPEPRAWRFTKPDRTEFYFDCEGYISSVVDNNGNELTFVYDVRRSNNQPTKFLRYILDATGRRTLTINYWAKGENYDYINDTTWTRQSATNLTNPFIIDHIKDISDISGRKLTFTYTDKGLLGELIDGAGSTQPKVFKFAYDMTQGNKNVKLVKVTDPRGNPTNLAYYSNPGDDPKFKWSTKTITDRLGFATSFAYTDPDGTGGQNIENRVTDAENHSATYLLDGKGRPLQVTNAKAQVTKLTWDADNNVEKMVEANNATTTFRYDPKTGYPLEVRDAEANSQNYPGQTLRYQVGLNGNTADLIEKQSPEGRLWKFAYDAEGDLTKVTDPLGSSTSTVDDYTTVYTYDTWGQLLTIKDPNGNITENSDFHPSGYPRKIADARQRPLGKATAFTYDDRGQVLDVTDANGKKTTQVYDVYGRSLENRVPKRQDQGELIVTPAPAFDANDNSVTTTAPELWVNGTRVGPAGAVSTATYDKADQLVAHFMPKDMPADPERKTTYTYDKVGNQLTTTEPKGNLTSTVGDFVTTNAYDEIYQLTSVTDASGNKLSYTYTNVGDVEKIIDPRKNLTPDPDDYTTWFWIDLNHRARVVLDGVSFELTTYDRDGKVVEQTDKAQNATKVTLDARALPVEVKVPYTTTGGTVEDRATRYEYDQVGNRTKVITPRGVATAAAEDFLEQTTYDELNRVKEQIAPYALADPRYNKVDKTIYTYDDVGRLTKVSAPPSETQTVRNDTSYTYFDNGWTATAKDAWDITTGYDYNPLGQQTRNTLTPAGGNPSDTQSPNRTMTWSYFGDGKLSARADDGVPVGRHVVLVDNADFNNTKTTGTWTTASSATGFQGFNYQTHAAGAGADTFDWSLNVPKTGNYDVYVKYPGVTGASTSATYKVTHSGGTTDKPVNQTQNAGTWVNIGRFAFAEGNTAKVSLGQSAGGIVAADAVKLVRDTTGEPADTEAKNFTYRYDPNANLTTITDTSAGRLVDSYNVAYTGLNQVDKVDELRTGNPTPVNTTTFTYDPNGAIKTSTHPRAFASYDYDTRNLVSTVTNRDTPTDPTPKVTTYTYTPKQERLKETKGNGNTVDYTYYLDGQLETEVEKKPDGTAVSEHTMAYDANGNRSQDVARKMSADSPGTYLATTSNYTYDPRDRVATVTKTGHGADTETYVHDANDNVISQRIKSVTTAYNYYRNRLLTTVTNGTTTNYNYDPFGRLDTVTALDQVLERKVYDGFDHVVEHRATNGATTTTSRYVFDPLDRTAAKTTDVGTAKEKTTTFSYLGLSGEVLDEDVAGLVTKSYEYSPWGERLSQVKHNTDGTQEDTYYGYNPHSDVETLTDSAGNTKATYGYSAYGDDDDAHFTGVDKPVPADPTKEPYNPYRFNAKRWDQMSGTYDMGFRDYSPGLNRFTTRDMYNGALADMNLGVSPFTNNRYAFAGGNPISRIEYDGHDWYDPRDWCDSCEDAAGDVADEVAERGGDALDWAGDAAEWMGDNGGDLLSMGLEMGLGVGLMWVGTAMVVGGGAVCIVTLGGGCVLVPATTTGGFVVAGTGMVVTGHSIDRLLNNDWDNSAFNDGDGGGGGGGGQRLREPTPGDRDGGPGRWREVNNDSRRGMDYQEQVSGTKRNYEYRVNGRDFDGWDSARNTLLDAKDGYGGRFWFKDGELTDIARSRFLNQGRGQLEDVAGTGSRVEWQFSNRDVANATRDLFEEEGIDITVKYVPTT